MGENNGRRTQHNATQYKDIQHNDTHYKGLICDTQYKWQLAYMALCITMLWHYAECQYAVCHILFIRILIIRVIVIMLNDVMLSVMTTIILLKPYQLMSKLCCFVISLSIMFMIITQVDNTMTSFLIFIQTRLNLKFVNFEWQNFSVN